MKPRPPIASRSPRGRATSVTLLCIVLIAAAAAARAQPASPPRASTHLADIPSPLPFPAGASVFQWDYQCVPDKPCSFTGFGIGRQRIKAVTVVLANVPVGEWRLPTYFVWETLADGGQVSGFTQDPALFSTTVVNMKLSAAGPPGL